MSKKILIVDDEPDVLKVVQYSLLKEGYEIIMAENGKKALEMATLEMPDLILLDLMMPEMDGLEVCRRFQADENLKSIPVILMTANKAKSLDDKLLSVAIKDRIIKPFEAEEMFEKVKKL